MIINATSVELTNVREYVNTMAPPGLCLYFFLPPFCVPGVLACWC